MAEKMNDPNDPNVLEDWNDHERKRIAGEIISSTDNRFADVVCLLESLEAASEYILCLRQIVYAGEIEVMKAAKSRANQLGSRWRVFATQFEEIISKYPDYTADADLCDQKNEDAGR